jgi:hypothetical protein
MARVNLREDRNLVNYAGRDAIHRYLLVSKSADMEGCIKSQGYKGSLFRREPVAGDLSKAQRIIEDVLSGVTATDNYEAWFLVESFISIRANEELAERVDKIIEQLNVGQELNEQTILNKLTDIEALNMVGDASAFISHVTSLAKDLYDSHQIVRSISIDNLWRELPGNLSQSGIKESLLKISNQQFKRLLRAKIPNISNSLMQEIISAKNKGVLHTQLNSTLLQLGPEDVKNIIGNLDDFQIVELTRNIDNFRTITTSVSNTSKLVQSASAGFEKFGHALGVLQLVQTLKTDSEVSPADILSSLPIVGALGFVIKHYTDKLDSDINESIFDVAPDWDFVLNWERNWKGKSGIPNEYLYLCYTNDQGRFNKNVTPTSIIIKDYKLAQEIFGFTPAYVDFDIQSKIIYNEQDGTTLFRPTKQVKWGGR